MGIIMVGSLNIASYYTGAEKSLFVQILQTLDEESFLPMVPSLFQRISVYPTLNEEQRLAMTYHDNIKKLIIDRLKDEGVVKR